MSHFSLSRNFISKIYLSFGLFSLIITFLVSPLSLAQEKSESRVKTEHLELEFLSENEVLGVGQNFFAFHFSIQPEWHIYWKNPGDSGAAPKFELIGLNGQTMSEFVSVSWPNPDRIPVGPFFNFGYEGKVAFPFERSLTEEDVRRGSYRMDFRIEWLVCKVECVPGFANVSLDLPVAKVTRSSSVHKATIRKFLEKGPAPRDVFAKEALLSPQFLLVKGELIEKDSEWINIFPHSSEFFQTQAPEVDWSQGELEFIVQRVKGVSPPFPQQFLVVQGFRTGEVRSYDLIVKSAQEVASLPQKGFDGEMSGSHSAESSYQQSSIDESLFLLLVFAFLGGLILNLMPCVFPVLSIKVFSLLKAEGKKSQLIADSIFYFAGVVATFLALGAVFLILRALGQNVGWGFQLQSPLFIYFMCVLFFALALNFLGLFEFGESIMAWAGQKSHEKSSSFLTGALSVLVATPCTGPFMGSALGATVSLSSVEALLIFLFLGVGMGSPFLLLIVFPRLIQLLPRPGIWMLHLKEFFAFPLFATVLWLSWILIRQVGTGGMLPVGLAVLGMSLFVWAKSRAQHKSLKRIFVVLAFVSALGPLFFISPQSSATKKDLGQSETTWEPYSEKKLAELRSQGIAVFIDFTADWCITCQWNKKAVLETERAMSLFKENNVYLMRADWTNQDEEITRALSAFGRASVPVYAFYPAGAQNFAGSEAQLLPQILRIEMIENLFKKEN